MPNENEREFISIIYNKKNDSPKYVELKKSKLLLFVIGLPTLTLIALVLGVIGLVHTSPFHLIDTYRQNELAREAVSKTQDLASQLQKAQAEKTALTQKLADMDEALKKAKEAQAQTGPQTAPQATKTPEPAPQKPKVCPPVPAAPTIGSIGLSPLSLFRPIQGQKDKTRPATVTLSGFKVESKKDTVNLMFNIIPATVGEGKLSGHIVVFMKNEFALQVYPQAAFNTQGTQINYSSGEPFSTQRFRPVDASFLKPRKSGNNVFTVYIFAKNGDLIHYQSVQMPVKI